MKNSDSKPSCAENSNDGIKTYYCNFGSTHIKVESIKKFNIVDREYICRPVYKEIGVSDSSESNRYQYIGMAAYAGFLDDEQHHDIESIKSNKFDCVTQKGRKVHTCLDNIPAVIQHKDGKISYAHRFYKIYSLLGEPIEPTIRVLPALQIHTDERDYIFYGHGIHVDDVKVAYNYVQFNVRGLKALRLTMTEL